MKTIRHNTFETNSSSTHAYSVSSVNASNRVDLNIIPDENGQIVLGMAAMDDDANPQSKISHMLKYADVSGNQELYDRITKVVEDHVGGKLFVQARVFENGKWVDKSPHTLVSKPRHTVISDDDEDSDNEDEDEDAFSEMISDEFYGFTCEYGHGSVREFVKDMEAIAATDESLKTFFFSSKQGVSIESYYN